MANQGSNGISWLDPLPIGDYYLAPTGAGIYVVGRARDASKAIVASSDYDEYLFNWPDNLHGLYVGISESNGRGIRGRLSSHARGRGNKDVASRLKHREKLWFIASPGIDGVDFENLFLVLINRSAMFTSNRRDEMKRYSARLNRRIEEQMRAEGKAIINFTEILDDYYRS